MATFDVRNPGVPFHHTYTLTNGVTVPVLHPRDVEAHAGSEVTDEAEQVRVQVAATVAPSCRSLLEGLSVVTLTEMLAAYQGWFAAYIAAVKQRAAGIAHTEAPMPQRPQPASLAIETARTHEPEAVGTVALPAPAPGVARISTGRQLVKPGGRLPQSMGGHAVGAARPAGSPPIDISGGVGEPFPLSAFSTGGANS